MIRPTARRSFAAAALVALLLLVRPAWAGPHQDLPLPLPDLDTPAAEVLFRDEVAATVERRLQSTLAHLRIIIVDQSFRQYIDKKYSLIEIMRHILGGKHNFTSTRMVILNHQTA